MQMANPLEKTLMDKIEGRKRRGRQRTSCLEWHHRPNRPEFEQAQGDGEGEGSLTCCCPWGRSESDTTEQLTNNNQGIIIVVQTLSHVLLFATPRTVARLPMQGTSQEDALKKEMATQSSILAWEDPKDRGAGELQAMQLQRIRHDLTTIQQAVFKYLSCIIGSEGKVFACDARDPSLIPGLGRSLGEGNSYPLQYSCLENSMERGH